MTPLYDDFKRRIEGELLLLTALHRIEDMNSREAAKEASRTAREALEAYSARPERAHDA